MTYPGGKSQAGVGQWLINHMPPHSVYIEAFLGAGAVMKMKRPAPVANIGIDADGDVIHAFRDGDAGAIDLYVCDAIEWLKGYDLPPDALIYCDPPYLMSTRLSKRKRYRCEMTDAQHAALLDVLKSLKCMVMISGYYSDMYASFLYDWRTDWLNVRTRGGAWAKEMLWLNFAEPFELHDDRFLGADFRERERIKRLIGRWVRRVEAMPVLERAALLRAINAVRDHHAESGDGCRQVCP